MITMKQTKLALKNMDACLAARRWVAKQRGPKSAWTKLNNLDFLQFFVDHLSANDVRAAEKLSNTYYDKLQAIEEKLPYPYDGTVEEAKEWEAKWDEASKKLTAWYIDTAKKKIAWKDIESLIRSQANPDKYTLNY